MALPDTSAIADDVLPVPGNADARLDYEHFSIVMSKSRRLALFTAVNIDGSASVSVSRGGDPWAFDGRIPEDAQAGDELYADNDFDRGHLVRREDLNWGPTARVQPRHFSFHQVRAAAFDLQPADVAQPRGFHPRQHAPRRRTRYRVHRPGLS